MDLRRSLLFAALAVLATACTASPSNGAPAPSPTESTPEAPPVLQQASGPVDPARKLTTAPGGTVTVEVVPQYETVFAGDRTLNVLLRLSGTGDAPAERPPLDLALVIDRSGSMSGDKLRSVKEAALKLLDRLGERDRVSLLSYSSNVQAHTTRLPVDAEGREALRNHILRINSSGMTALGPAMFQALETLGRTDGGDLRLAHVMLLSDGIANVGESRPQILGARAASGFTHGITVSTLGVGLDYNEDLMTRLADQGGGRYHFIRDNTATAQVLDDEMNGLVATVARGVELDLSLLPGVDVAQVFGYPMAKDGNTAHVRVGTLGAGQTREILVRLTLPPGGARHLDLGKLGVRFLDVPADGAARRIDVPLAVATTPDQKLARATERTEVTVRVAELESAAQLETAARAVDRGDFSGASNSLQVAIGQLEEKAKKMPGSKKLRDQLADLKSAEGEIVQAKGSAMARKAYTKKNKAKAYKSRKR